MHPKLCSVTGVVVLWALSIQLPPPTPAFGQPPPAAAPNSQELVQRATKTMNRLQDEAVSWKAIFEVSGRDVKVQIATQQSGANSTATASILADDASQELFRIHARDGVWYLVQDGSVAKYRPYETPIALPSMYMFLAKSDKFIVTEQLFASAKFESLKGNIATYRTPLPESARRQLQLSLNAFAESKKLNPDRNNSELERIVSNVRESLERGMTIDIDIDSGIIVESGVPGNRYWVKDLDWQAPESAAALPIELVAAADHTKPITDVVESRDDLAMISHAGGWAPGQPAIDTEAVILNIRTGEIRRVPFSGGGTLTGCFAKDRYSVFISGLVIEEGGTGLFQVDLGTGATKRISEETLKGFTIFPTLSPDGRYLACLNKAGSEPGILDSQVCVVELATGRVQKIGAPLDTAFLSWFPDQTGLLLITRKRGDPKLPSEETIARMNLNGQITPIRSGTFPIILGSQRRILFVDDMGRKDRKWMSCDFAGKYEKMLGDGLAEFGFPALAPDGKRLIMMRLSKSTGPRPYVVDLSTGESSPINVGKGLWAMPAWR